MKLAISGKGGVGKTTISALLAWRLLAGRRKVIAIDVDPNTCLLECMGYENAGGVRPLVEMKDLIEERTGVKPGSIGAMFRLNPPVDDIPDLYGVDVAGIKVLVAGAVKRGGAGCYCPENALVRGLVSHLLLDESTALVLDMEAGLEHLSRGTVQSVDRLIIVTDPARRSVETAFRIVGLAADLKVPEVIAVGNRIRTETDRDFLKTELPDIEFAGFVPYDEAIAKAESARKPPWGVSVRVDEAISKIVEALDEE